jgi:Fur family ferric uptake transcriptional regulator
VATWAAALRRTGRRVTGQRLAVMRAASDHHHATAEELHRKTLGDYPTMALATVHAIVNDLTEAGLLRRIEVPQSPALYEPDAGDNHHHAQCVRCGRIEDVECAVGHAPCLTPSNTHGMKIEVAEVLYRGVCADCAAKIENPTTQSD